MSAQVAADLRAAAEVLRRDGWTQGTYHDSQGCHCAEGAIALVTGNHVQAPEGDDGWWEDNPEMCEISISGTWFSYPQGGPMWQRREAAELAVGEAVLDNVADWNDAPGRTADEVIAALEAAADAAERKAAYDEGRWCGECIYGVVMDPPCCTQAADQ